MTRLVRIFIGLFLTAAVALSANRSQQNPLSSSRPTGTRLTRRVFITLVWKTLLGVCGVLGLDGLWRFFSYQPEPPRPTRFDLGPADAFPLDARATVPQAQAFVLRTANGLRAFSLVCPHLGCVLDLTEDGFECPCHGSQFGNDGTLKQGPADRSLRALKLEAAADGHLILDISEF